MPKTIRLLPMISFRLFAMILVTLVCREVAASATWNPVGTALLAMAGLTLGFALLHKALVLSILMRYASPGSGGGGTVALASTADMSNAFESQQSAARLRVIIDSLWVMALPATLLLTGWGVWLKAFDASGTLHTLTLVGWFLPSLSLVVLLELTEAQFEETLLEPIPQAVNSSWQELWLTRLRMGELPGLATCLVPVLIVACLSDLSTFLLGEGSESKLLLGGLCIVSISVFLVLLPNFFARWIGAQACQAGELRDQIAKFRGQLKLSRIEVRIVKTSTRWQGAAIVGWFPGFRHLWIGEGLLQRLDPQEVDMVVMHELAHVTRNHFLWRFLPILIAAFALVGGFATPWMMPPAWQATALQWAQIAGVAASTLCLVLGVSWIAKRCELDADRQACDLASRVCPWAQGSAPRAAVKLGDALSKLIGDSPDAARASWLHPSLAARLNHLRDHAQHMRRRQAATNLPQPTAAEQQTIE